VSGDTTPRKLLQQDGDELVDRVVARVALALNATAGHYRDCAPPIPDLCATLAGFLENEANARREINARETRDRAQGRIY
jgi:hypothetical protein